MKKNINRVILIVSTIVGIIIFSYLQNNLISVTEVK